MTTMTPQLLLSVATARALRAPVEVPATPDADSARRAAAEELSKPVYRHQTTGLWERIWQWLTEHLDLRSAVPGAPPWLSVLLVAALAITLLAALVVLVTRITWARRVARTDASLFEDDRDAAALTRAADDAAGQGDWARAVVERFRAVVRSLDERGVIEDYPGMTAHEAARLASGHLAALAGQMDEAARLFDAVRYGRIEPTSAEDAWMRDFADRVARTVLVPAPRAEQVIA